MVWPTHGWGWPPKIYLVWGHPCGQSSPTLGLILLVTSKIFLTALRGLDLSFCYISVKALMGNFEFRPWPAIFWRGHRCKKNSGIFLYAIAKHTRNDLVTIKWKFSYLLVKGLMANFQFQSSNPKFLLIKLIFEELRLLVKNPHFWSENPKNENLPLMHLPSYKKFLISGSPDHFLKGSLTKKLKSQKIILVRDPFKKWPATAKIQNFPLMPLLIYNKNLNPSISER